MYDERAKHEKEYFDREYGKAEELSLDVNPFMFAKYKTPADFADWRQRSAALLGDVKGLTLLDYGCGIGQETTYFALLGAEVCATEVSETAIALAKQRAAHNGVGASVRFFVVDGIRLEFDDNHFDRIHGLGVLHHVGLGALAEIKRVLKPGGRAVFLEHMGSSKFLVPMIRKLFRVREEYSPDEKPLDFSDVREAGKSFSACEIYPFHLSYRLRRFLPTWIHNSLLRLDAATLRWIPPLERYAGGAVILFVK